MRQLLGAALLTLPVFLTSLHAQEAEPKATADQTLLEDAAVKFVDSYNSKDAAALAALFGPQARIEEADGTVIVGSEAIEQSFAAAFEAEPAAQISLEMNSLQFVTPDVAVEEGATEFYPDGETLTAIGKYVVVHLKKDGVWRMASARALEREVVTNYEYLRALEWLVGEWVDEDADDRVETTFRWDDGRSFLLQEFTVKRGSDVVQKGVQRIGWDPQKKRFRGWIFDSQGGFGESTWTETDGSWVVKSTGVAPDGANGAATRTLTPMGDRILVTVTGRTLNGDAFDDVEFTMVKRPPLPAATAAR